MAVEILESCIVAPGEATPKHRLWLSIFDLIKVRTHTPLVYFYRRRSSPSTAFFSPGVLKAALSKALVPFYPIAGRLGSDSAGRLEIRCTGDGVLFVTARADATLRELENPAPSDELRRMLVPVAEGGNDDHAGVLAMFQVTFFKCGGVCLGTAIHHTVCDGRAFGNFLNTWAAVARGDSEALLRQPCLDRTLLRARSPPAVRCRFHHHTDYPRRGSVASKPKAPFRAAVLPISRNHVDALKAAAGAGKKVSTFTAVVAHVWRCACEAKGLRGTEATRVYMAADVRSRVHPHLPEGYLGNAVARTSTVVAKAEDVVSSPLSAVADNVSAATARLSDEYIRSLGDYLEQAMSHAPGLHLGQWDIPDSDMYVVSWIGLPIYDVDFGWGRPTFMGRATLKRSNLVYISSIADGQGRLNVTVTMNPLALLRFKVLFYEGLKHYPHVSQVHVALDAPAVKHSKL